MPYQGRTETTGGAVSDLPRVIPGELPAYEAVGNNTLMLLSEFSRPITVTCGQCPTEVSLKLLADELLSEEQCDEVLSGYLADIGWRPGPPDYCPTCKEAS
jgi:hypothetical protein